MFSFFSNSKKRQSPDESGEPPIPGPNPDDGFVMVNQNSGQQPNPTGSLYPSFNGSGQIIYPNRPAPSIPAVKPIEVQVHYLQGVPFKLSKELLMNTNKDAYAVQIGDLLAFTTRKLHLDAFNYDFTVEKSVLHEVS